jgi:hypothetical protein
VLIVGVSGGGRQVGDVRQVADDHRRSISPVQDIGMVDRLPVSQCPAADADFEITTRLNHGQVDAAPGFIHVTVYSSDPVVSHKKPRAHAFAEAGPGCTSINVRFLRPMLNPFPYLQRIINKLERALSTERLSIYLAAANDDHAAALRLYV